MNYTFAIRFRIITAMIAGAVWASAAVPQGYYESCEGKSGKALLEALHKVISGHTDVGYDGLFDVYRTSDADEDGKLIDIYSTKRWSMGEKCGSYQKVGNCFNREHSFPKSWFGGKVRPMYSDAFHLYPTDGKVNGQRSNYPYGECAGGTSESSNGSIKALGRLGNCTFAGYSGTVFEPDDQYKGDLARTYFYMAACYNDKVSGFTKGNGTYMLAGNNYPVYKEWAINMLLKWARQDVLSQKEIDRNEAIYQWQKNRNPFVDYPELVEYIWGNKSTTPWYSNTTPEASISLPAEGHDIDLGYAAKGMSRRNNVRVQGVNLTQPLAVSVTGAGFTTATTSISASQAIAGVNLDVTVNTTTVGAIEGKLTLKSSEVSAEYKIKAEVVDGLPIMDAINVTAESFDIRWVDVETDMVDYTVHLKQGAEYVTGYPVSVLSSRELYEVEGVDPGTTYTYYIESPALRSRTVTVTTAELLPSIALLYDGELEFDAAPGVPSDVAELLLEIDNIATDITVSVEAPFEVSTDKSSWSTTTTLSSEEDRFYMRVNSAEEGDFETEVTLEAGEYMNDDAVATAKVGSRKAFVEDFEIAKTFTDYSQSSFDGNACKWLIKDACVNKDNKGLDNINLRLGKSASSSITMAEDKEGGIGKVSFDAVSWSTSDGSAVLTLEYSTDGGSNWTEAEEFTVEAGAAANYSATVNVTGAGRIRLVQKSGSRACLDNITITDYTSSIAVNEKDYHSWDAFCRGGKLVVESADDDKLLSVYGMDGIAYVNRRIAAGSTEIALPMGLYVVVIDGFARRVLVK